MTLILHRKFGKHGRGKQRKYKGMAEFLGRCFQIAFWKSFIGILSLAVFEQSCFFSTLSEF